MKAVALSRQHSYSQSFGCFIFSYSVYRKSPKINPCSIRNRGEFNAANEQPPAMFGCRKKETSKKSFGKRTKGSMGSLHPTLATFILGVSHLNTSVSCGKREVVKVVKCQMALSTSISTSFLTIKLPHFADLLYYL